MHEFPATPAAAQRPVRSPERVVAVGGTLASAALFLAAGLGSLVVNNGVFSAGIAVMLVLYALMLAVIARAARAGSTTATGAVVASALLHVLVGVSTARGSHQWWIWLAVALAAVTLLAGLRVHLQDLKEQAARQQ